MSLKFTHVVISIVEYSFDAVLYVVQYLIKQAEPLSSITVFYISKIFTTNGNDITNGK